MSKRGKRDRKSRPRARSKRNALKFTDPTSGGIGVGGTADVLVSTVQVAPHHGKEEWKASDPAGYAKWFESVQPAVNDMQKAVKMVKEVMAPVESTLRLHQSAVAKVVRAHEQLGVPDIVKEAAEKAREVEALLKRYGVKY
jgi:gas vesicle protein